MFFMMQYNSIYLILSSSDSDTIVRSVKKLYKNFKIIPHGLFMCLSRFNVYRIVIIVIQAGIPKGGLFLRKQLPELLNQ